MASLIVLSGVVGYYLYKENKTKKQNKLNGRMTSPTIAVVPSGTGPREAKLRELEHYGDIPPTYQHALIQPPSQYTHELTYTPSNSDEESPKRKEGKYKRRPKLFGSKRSSSPKI